MKLLASTVATQAREMSPVLLKPIFAHEPSILKTGLALSYIADFFCASK